MKISVKDIKGKAAGELDVRFPLVEGGKGTQAVHDVVTAFRAGQRSGTACTKTAGEVVGTNKKPWRQKGIVSLLGDSQNLWNSLLVSSL